MALTQVLDEPTRTLLARVADVGIPAQTLQRHLPVLRQCLGPRDTALIVTACARSERPRPRGRLRDILLLSRYRLVVTCENRLTHRLRLHLNADFGQLAEVAWTAEPERGGVQFAATAVDGVREHLWIRLGSAERVWWLDAMLRDAFAVTVRSEPATGARTAERAEPAA